jgi:hypothetical protein
MKSDWDNEVKTLEAKYADRGLVFTSPFEGFAPIQAYGHLDGKRFYFRLRGGEASLRVGIYDLAIEIERKKRRNVSLGYPADSSEVFKAPKESDPDLYPTVVQCESYADSYKRKMVELFSILVETLEAIPTETSEKS